MTDDIVTTLRREPFYHSTSRINSFGMPQMGFELTSFGLIAADEIERLRAERDEARRMYCEELSLRAFGDTSCAWEEASIRSWNCFEEVKP